MPPARAAARSADTPSCSPAAHPAPAQHPHPQNSSGPSMAGGDLRSHLDAAQAAMGEAVELVMADIRAKYKELTGGPGVIEGVKAFAAAVDWSERWIVGLLAAHALLLLVVLARLRSKAVQGAAFFLCGGTIFFAERINRLAGQHWRRFSRHNYFDPQGIFTSALLSVPLLLIMFVVLVNYLVQTSALLVRMKRRELAYRARQQQRAAEGSGAGAGATGASAAGEGKKTQ
eukprot:scaffold9.g3187.t1